jgi:tyrosyl-tRNA synthetase
MSARTGSAGTLPHFALAAELANNVNEGREADKAAQLTTLETMAVQLRRDPSARVAHRVLAREATRIIHGDEGVAAAEGATAVLFGDEPFAGLNDEVLAAAFDEAPSVTLERERLAGEGLGLLDAMTAAGLTAGTGEARRLVQQGAVRLNNRRIDDPQYRLGPEDLAGATTAVLRAGKKRYALVRFA